MCIIKEIKSDTVSECKITSGMFIVNLIGYTKMEPDQLQESLYNSCEGLREHVELASDGNVCKFGSYSIYEGIINGKKVTICNAFCKYEYLKKKIFLKTQALTSALTKMYKEQDVSEVLVLYLGFRELNHFINNALPVKTTIVSTER